MCVSVAAREERQGLFCSLVGLFLGHNRSLLLISRSILGGVEESLCVSVLPEERPGLFCSLEGLFLGHNRSLLLISRSFFRSYRPTNEQKRPFCVSVLPQEKCEEE